MDNPLSNRTTKAPKSASIYGQADRVHPTRWPLSVYANTTPKLATKNMAKSAHKKTTTPLISAQKNWILKTDPTPKPQKSIELVTPSLQPVSISTKTTTSAGNPSTTESPGLLEEKYRTENITSKSKLIMPEEDNEHSAETFDNVDDDDDDDDDDDYDDGDDDYDKSIVTDTQETQTESNQTQTQLPLSDTIDLSNQTHKASSPETGTTEDANPTSSSENHDKSVFTTSTDATSQIDVRFGEIP